MNKIVAKPREAKISLCKKTAGLRCGKISDLNSACSKMLVHVKIFQFQNMLDESERYCDATNSLKTVQNKAVYILPTFCKIGA